MLASQKTCKKPKKPQAIDSETWKTVEAAMCIGGLGYSEAGRKIGIEPHAIMMKAKRHGWALPSMIQKRVEALQKSVTERAVCEGNRACNDQAVEIIAQSWVEKAEAHRAIAFDLAHTALREAARKGLPIESWRDADLADRSARRNAGLDSEEGSRIQIGLALIETRLQAINLPKDALPEK
jgi:hypothetical protein